jgi:hypothetical protein
LQDYDKKKRLLKDDTRKWLELMMKDRWAYVSLHKETIDVYDNCEKHYWRIVLLNPDNYYLQKICLDSIQNVNAARSQIYDVLPEIAGGNFLTLKNGNENTISTTTAQKAQEIPRALQN